MLKLPSATVSNILFKKFLTELVLKPAYAAKNK